MASRARPRLKWETAKRRSITRAASKSAIAGLYCFALRVEANRLGVVGDRFGMPAQFELDVASLEIGVGELGVDGDRRAEMENRLVPLLSDPALFAPLKMLLSTGGRGCGRLRGAESIGRLWACGNQ